SMYQGFFVYRRDRLIQAGGWFGLLNDETEPHSSLARIKLDLPEGTEELFSLNVQKSAVIPPIGFQEAVRESMSMDGATWDSYRSEAIRVYRAGDTAVAPKSFGLGVGFSERIQTKDQSATALKLDWSEKEGAPLVELVGDCLVFNSALRTNDRETFPQLALDALALTFASLLSEGKGQQRLRVNGTFLDPQLLKAFDALLR
ncbi:hypothetical protein OBB00_09115, partial [Gammaproteobacteria bacterium]|nr:hypothetical protein [Gammaproteobacteria bacterium]